MTRKGARAEVPHGRCHSICVALIGTVVLCLLQIFNFLPEKRWDASFTSALSQANINTADPVHTLQLQKDTQNEFQDLIYRNQYPVDCSQRRIVFTPTRALNQDGFTLEVQDYGRRLLEAIAQDRTLVLRDNAVSAYAPASCLWGSASNFSRRNQYECLFLPFTNCTEQSVDASRNGNEHQINASNMAGIGVIKDNSRYFHAGAHGPQRVIDGAAPGRPRFWNADHIEHWERSMGRFWIRAQLAQYIWQRLDPDFQKEVMTKLPKNLIGIRYIGMHVRFTDNVGSLWNDFGRDGGQTRSVDHFMDIATEIRKKTGISNVYIATDSTTFLNRLFQNTTYPNDGWSFFRQAGVMRSNSSAWMWFKNNRQDSGVGIAADVEVLRRADYLIGSFQSNVYRLATELNTAYHVANYSIHMHRHYPVDIEYYEDP